MIKSTIRKSEYEAIYRLLDLVSPVPFDCGTLCDAICCRSGEELAAIAEKTGCGHAMAATPVDDPPEMGIYLLPGEEKLHNRHDDWLYWKEELAEDYDFPDSWKGKIYFVRCKTPPFCPREKRPLQCRTFPLSPHFTGNGQLVMVMNDLDLPYLCPLIAEGAPLDPDYLKATYLCWKRLVDDPLIRDLVLMDSQDRKNCGIIPPIIYPANEEERKDSKNSDFISFTAELMEKKTSDQ